MNSPKKPQKVDNALGPLVKGIANESARSASRLSATVIGDVISASIGIEIPELIDLVFEVSEESDVEVCEC